MIYLLLQHLNREYSAAVIRIGVRVLMQYNKFVIFFTEFPWYYIDVSEYDSPGQLENNWDKLQLG